MMLRMLAATLDNDEKFVTSLFCDNETVLCGDVMVTTAKIVLFVSVVQFTARRRVVSTTLRGVGGG